MRSVILGTDWWTDCDDAVAVRVLSHYVKGGNVRLLGVCINACMPYSVASLRGFLSYEGLADVPVGLDAEATDFGGAPAYQKRLADRLGVGITNADAEDGVRLYRRLLAAAEEPVELVEIGYFQVVAALLASGPDELSPKTGRTLVAEKVARIWAMAGKWDADGERENNFCRSKRARAAAAQFCALCPVPVTFLGWEVGYGVLTGGALAPADPLHGALVDHGSAHGRHSWDPMLMQLAMVGDARAAGYDVVRGRASVDAETGANYFSPDAAGPHAYVVKVQPDSYYAEEINRLL